MSLFLAFMRCALDKMMAFAESFGYVEDEGVLGVLRESLIESLLEPLLMPPYRAGAGVVIDSQGHQSGQCDIIIWDDSIFRPMYAARGAGVYLIESVVATIEVKSTLKRDSFVQAIQRSRDFKEMAILRPSEAGQHPGYWDREPDILPINILFGFCSDSQGSEQKRAVRVADREKIELHEYLQAVIVPRKDSWIFQKDNKDNAQRFKYYEEHPYHEVLMPLSALLNTLKLVSSKRGKPNLGFYIVPYQVDH